MTSFTKPRRPSSALRLKGKLLKCSDQTFVLSGLKGILRIRDPLCDWDVATSMVRDMKKTRCHRLQTDMLFSARPSQSFNPVIP
jgi:hypothetical protein